MGGHPKGKGISFTIQPGKFFASLLPVAASYKVILILDRNH